VQSSPRELAKRVVLALRMPVQRSLRAAEKRNLMAEPKKTARTMIRRRLKRTQRMKLLMKTKPPSW